MQKIVIVLKYPQVERYWRNWAVEENDIDFRHEPEKADRCTACYAASELKYFLCKAMKDIEFSVSGSRPQEGYFIELVISGNDHSGSFELKPANNGIVVTGSGRNGLLNGCYELLRIQGWRWLEPGIFGESAPAEPDFGFLKAQGKFVPSFKHRMIDQYRDSDDSVELLKWFSRNRINVVFRKPATGKFADKLGMLSRTGGHLLMKVLDPDALMADGRTVWEAHPEWYGLPADGKRVRERALKTQLCLSNREMVNWLSAEICRILQSSMKDIDILDLWGLDGGGRTCSCKGCRGQGNGSDQNLKLLSEVQYYLQKHLDRPVILNTVSYDNSDTMVAPTLPVPQNLIDTGCLVIFYPIHRCYRHQLGDHECRMNRIYDEAITGWHRNAPGLDLWAGEYYNVSRFEDMPLVFGKMIPAEMRYYHANGCTGATYMHNFSPNWGIRALTQLLHTQFAWQVDTCEEAFIDEYFSRKYGAYSAAMKKVYRHWELAGKDIALWRNWEESLLTDLDNMEGDVPQNEIVTAHFDTEEKTISALREVVRHADLAVAGLRKVLAEEQQRNWQDLPALKDLPPLVVPTDLEEIRYYNKMEYRLGEDLRGMLYGAEIFRLEYNLLKYHNALRLGKNGGREWQQVEQSASKLNEMLVPVTYDKPAPGMGIQDGLTRSQLRMCVTRCRGYRIRQQKKR